MITKEIQLTTYSIAAIIFFEGPRGQNINFQKTTRGDRIVTALCVEFTDAIEETG